MEQIERIGISVDKNLLNSFDKLISRQGYQNRSEAIRDLIRERISAEKLKNPKTKTVAAVLIVYEHQATQLMEKLTSLQHSHLLETISSLHIHIDDHKCMEAIILRGQVGKIKKTAEQLISLKGVTHGKINLMLVEPE